MTVEHEAERDQAEENAAKVAEYVGKTYSAFWVDQYTTAIDRGATPLQALDQIERGVRRARDLVFGNRRARRVRSARDKRKRRR